jgi:hypothetical protein
VFGQDPLVAPDSHLTRRSYMLLTISTTHRPATDLAGLLGQHPDAIRAATYPFGHAMVCFSQADEARCSAAVMLQHPGQQARPSMLADALADLFEPARTLAGPSMAFEVDSPLLPCAGGAERLWELFGPLGYNVVTTPVQGGEPEELAVRLAAEVPLSGLLSDLCTRLPALDKGAKSTRTARTIHRLRPPIVAFHLAP